MRALLPEAKSLVRSGHAGKVLLHRAALLAILILAPCSYLSAEPLRVAVASNFVPALEQLRENFTTRTGTDLQLAPGSTGKHYAQIRQGAPFDVFLAADEARPRLLESEGYALEGSRFTYALGRLVLWTPGIKSQDTPALRLSEMLQHAPDMRLSMANPRLAPYGAAAEEWLRGEALWGRLETRAVQGENIGQAFHFVATGSVPAGLVARSQLNDLEITGSNDYLLIDSRQHQPIRQQAVLLRESEAAREFMTWLQSDAVRAQIQSFGYDLPDAEP